MAGSRKTRADAGEAVQVVTVERDRSEAADVARKERRSSDMERDDVVFVVVWGKVKADAAARMDSRAVLRKDLMM